LEDIIAIGKQEAIPGFKVPKDVIIEVGPQLSGYLTPCLDSCVTLQPQLIRHVASSCCSCNRATTVFHQRPWSGVFH
jgi:hypothetical protein